MLIPELASSAGAILGMGCLVIWPFARSRRQMLLIQLGIPMGYFVHFALQGLGTATVVNAIAAVQILVMLLFGDSVRVRAAGYALAAAMVASSLVPFDGALSLMAAAGMGLIAVGRVQDNPNAMLLLVLAGSPFWMAHDVLIQSPLIIGDILSLATGSFAILRDVQVAPPAMRPSLGTH